MTVSGGLIGGKIDADHDSTMSIIGSDFNFAYGDYVDGGPLDLQVLTGTLADGTPINNLVWIGLAATVTLAVPEPSTFMAFVSGLCGILGFGYRQRRRKAA